MEDVKLLMGMMSLEETLESTQKGIYPMVVDGIDKIDPNFFFGDVDPTEMNGKEGLASYYPSENGKRGYYTGDSFHNVKSILLSNGTEASVVRNTFPSRFDEEKNKIFPEIDQVTGEQIPLMSAVYTLSNGQTVSLEECIRQIEEMNPIGASKS